MRNLVVCGSLFLAGTAFAQFNISKVVNAASRQTGAIAQGSLFAVLGKGVGPSDIQQASFPLPTTDGLGGVTIQIVASDQTVVNAIMVYVKPNEIGAILPSSTPTGAGTLTVNNNGATAAASINVVPAAFGIFTQNYGFGAGFAVAFNVNSDGTTTPNGIAQSVMPEQDVFINGTGLGAIPSDETQPGVTDMPATAIQVYVGVFPATVVSAGRGSCCDGIDPNYLVPQGIAAWDVIRFTVPDGVVGCGIPVVVQIGTQVSNLATISIDPSGAACTPPASTVPPDLALKFADQTGVAIGSIALSRSFGSSVTAAGVLKSTNRDTGSATFVDYPNLAASTVEPWTIYQENVCTINGFPNANGLNTTDGTVVTIVPEKSVPFDAGTPIVVKGASGSRSIVKKTAGAIFDYPGVTFGDTTAGNFYDSGTFSVTGPGGKDVGAFAGSVDVPTPQFAWTNIPDITAPLDRTQDLTINWTGGTPNTQVTVVGGSDVGGVNAAFECVASVTQGTLTIPSYVLLSMPASTATSTSGSLNVGNRVVTLFSAPSLDYGIVGYSLSYNLTLKYQ